MSDWIAGQRCASQGEPTLGLGIVKDVGVRNITVLFPATSTQRIYARNKAPLKRVSFEPGDEVRDNQGNSFLVAEVKEQNGILFYLGAEHEILPETELDHSLVYSRPDEQLLAGQIFKPKEFDLRVNAWEIRSRSLSSPSRGFIGARIELVPHQLYIAQEVARRYNPRVLLSDEVGLGKTIEAGLIFHQMWITGRARRVLCLVPKNLVNQWLTELYRKFNILFNIMTAGHAREIEKTHPGMNPYLTQQCIIQSIDEVSSKPQMQEQVTQAEWDLVIVDEAHHLYWSRDVVSEEYSVVQSLSKSCGALLLLTATPRQLGLESHFGRLKLLDHDRFDKFEAFAEEVDLYTDLADIADHVLEHRREGLTRQIEALFPQDADLITQAEACEREEADADKAFLQSLIDRHGTGRMVFRNKRKVLSGFPARCINPIALESNRYYEDYIDAVRDKAIDVFEGQRILAGAPAFQSNELDTDLTDAANLLQRAWRQDPRAQWLISFLRQQSDAKFLLICSDKMVVLALQEMLALAKNIELAVFHEDLSLVERDRQAAWFAKDDGAQVLLCSEIGSEGRNFQFAHNLILFDLPLNPSLLEQRIGRLDRIGQSEDIQIFVPYVKGSPMEYLYRWYHDGLDAFVNHLIDGDFIFEHLKQEIFTIFAPVVDPAVIDDFIEQSRVLANKVKETIEQGRDRLLELHSFNQEKAEALMEEIHAVDDDLELKDFMDRVFDLFGVSVTDSGHGDNQIVRPSPHMFVESFPGLAEDGMEITYDRNQAVTLEDLTFMSYDHPMVQGAIDLLLALRRGSTSFSLWKKAPQPGILVQCLFVLECPSAQGLALEEYLAPLPILVAVDQNQQLRPDLLEALKDVKLDKGPMGTLQQQRGALGEILESLIQIAEEEARTVADNYLEAAETKAMNSLKEEYDRLRSLQQINPSIRMEELDYIEDQLNLIVENLEESRMRLDALRMILMVPDRG
ncbi:RNA polymerase-associated protein RapA [Sulfidibacter corallicola]|uniref:RNA polymerase-associated protein RapA n=1 Tax=Sulfidibacter corallicola TaxID=2818388 RepID=A0A8A4TUG8_SULCO|nr:RNA polymerase-associated protein RapA [Sulfidibacter corallicola]QTD53123.1 RNA polymerase-associated protein RapA [Sulfidibacter corallicola]